MKLKDIIESVIEFPMKKRKRQVTMDKLRKKSKYYDEMTGLPTKEHPQFYDYFPELRDAPESPDEFWLVDDDGKGYAWFKTEKEAKRRRLEIEMKYKARGLHIVPMQ